MKTALIGNEKMNELRARFPWVTRFRQHGKDDLDADVESDDVSFERLAEMAEYFGTRDINIRGETGDHGYCDTCSDPFGYVSIRIGGGMNVLR